MTEEKKPLKIEFAPGCFDQFEGTQEELDAFMAEVTEMLTNMTEEELRANSRAVDIDQLIEDDPELAKELIKQLAQEDDPTRRTLQ